MNRVKAIGLPVVGQSGQQSSEKIALESFFSNINSVTVKVTGGCNLTCEYCNVDTDSPESPRMSSMVWRKISDLVISNSNHERVSIEFHGGEPLLLGFDFICEEAQYTRNVGSQFGKQIDIPMVTNGTLLRASMLDGLKQAGIEVLVSCDGPPHINNLIRGGGRGVERAIRLLVENGFLGRVMLVMSEVNYDKMYETMEWLSELGVSSMSVNNIQPQGRGLAHGILDAEQLFLGNVQIFEHMLRGRRFLLETRLAQQIERFVCGRQKRTQSCWDYECQAGRTYVSIDLFGQIHACGSDASNHILGNIFDDFIDRTFCSQKLTDLHRKRKNVLECFGCDARLICDHSCPTADYNTMEYAEAECDATKMLWKYFCDNIGDVSRVFDRIRRHII